MVCGDVGHIMLVRRNESAEKRWMYGWDGQGVNEIGQ